MKQNSNANELLKLNKATSTIEVSKSEAEELGAIVEDALTETDAIESNEGVKSDLTAI